MIDLIIFSRYRCAQLSLLLRSINLNAKGIFSPTVIFKPDKEYENGYNILIGKYPEVRWVEQREQDYFSTLTRIEIENSESKYLSIATDDSVIYRHTTPELVEYILPPHENVVGSLRLGHNTIVQDIHRGTIQPPLNVVVEHGCWMEWPIICYNPQENYGYPSSLDFHIFRTSLIRRLIEDMPFRNSSELEGKLTAFRGEIDYMRSFTESVVVNCPVNSAGGITQNGQIFPSSLEFLNNQWLSGKEIDLDSFSKEKIIGCHQEIDFKFKYGI